MKQLIMFLLLAGSIRADDSASTHKIAPVPNFEDITVYRLQLRIETCNNEDAGTDDDVYVQLNRADERYFLDKWSDDFVKGKQQVYDVVSKSIKRIRDIEFLKVGIRGDDGTCIRRVSLYVNNNASPIFSKGYDGHGNWIDNGGSFSIRRTELQSYDGWKFTPAHRNLGNPPAKQISKAMIMEFINASIGNQLNHQSQLAWGDKVWGLPNTRFGDGLEIDYVNNTTMHVDLDLKAKILGPNPEVDVDFDLVFSCKEGQVVAEITNLTIEGKGPVYQIQRLIREKGIAFVGAAIGAELGNPGAGAVVGGYFGKYLAFTLKLDLENPNLSRTCRAVTVNSDCSVVVSD